MMMHRLTTPKINLYSCILLVTFTIIFKLAVILRKIKHRTYINNYLYLWYKSRLPQFGQWASVDFEMKLRARLWIRTMETAQTKETKTGGFPR
jgi:hypothetical protein